MYRTRHGRLTTALVTVVFWYGLFLCYVSSYFSVHFYVLGLFLVFEHRNTPFM
jgi:hypothetical protein